MQGAKHYSDHVQEMDKWTTVAKKEGKLAKNVFVNMPGQRGKRRILLADFDTEGPMLAPFGINAPQEQYKESARGRRSWAVQPSNPGQLAFWKKLDDWSLKTMQVNSNDWFGYEMGEKQLSVERGSRAIVHESDKGVLLQFKINVGEKYVDPGPNRPANYKSPGDLSANPASQANPTDPLVKVWECRFNEETQCLEAKQVDFEILNKKNLNVIPVAEISSFNFTGKKGLTVLVTDVLYFPEAEIKGFDISFSKTAIHNIDQGIVNDPSDGGSAGTPVPPGSSQPQNPPPPAASQDQKPAQPSGGAAVLTQPIPDDQPATAAGAGAPSADDDEEKRRRKEERKRQKEAEVLQQQQPQQQRQDKPGSKRSRPVDEDGDQQPDETSRPKESKRPKKEQSKPAPPPPPPAPTQTYDDESSDDY